jgi:hypothetical protein
MAKTAVKDQDSPSCFSVAEGFYRGKVGRSIKLDIQLNLLVSEYLKYYVYTSMLFQKVVLRAKHNWTSQ